MSKGLGPLLVVGAGGHAKAVVGAAQVAGFDVLKVYDDDPDKWGEEVLGVEVIGPIRRILDAAATPTILAIGDPATRKAMVESLPLEWATLIHPNAFLESSVEVGPGTVMFAGVVCQPDARVGSHVILNANVTVASDCIVEDFAHLAPGVDLSHDVHVGVGVFMGIGAVTLPNLRVGNWTTVGAGAAVMSDLPESVVAVGSPARVIKSLVGKIGPREFNH